MAVLDRIGYRELSLFMLALMLLSSMTFFQGTAHSQVSPALTETWHSVDYGFTSRMI